MDEAGGVVRLYDCIGPLADSAAFYVDAALDRLTQLAAMHEASRIVEVGAGTGRYAARLLQHVLLADAQYADFEPSRRMRELAQQRLTPWRTRITIQRLDDQLPEAWANSVDRYIATYVLNVLPDRDAIRDRLEHAHRTLSDNGLLCLVNQTEGLTALQRTISTLWRGVYGAAPALLGNCRLLHARQYLDESQWIIHHCEVVCRLGFCSEVLVAAKRSSLTNIVAGPASLRATGERGRASTPSS